MVSSHEFSWTTEEDGKKNPLTSIDGLFNLLNLTKTVKYHFSIIAFVTQHGSSSHN